MMTIKLPNKFLSEDVYKACVDQSHFLIQLKSLFDWHGMALPLETLGKNAMGGRPRWSPCVLLKMLFIAFLFNLSDRDTEFHATNNLLVKCFLGLPIDEKAPDHTTICRFRETVLREKGVGFFRDLFDGLLIEAKHQGVTPSSIDALDATHTFANVDAKNPSNHDPKTPRDPDASWGCKGDEVKITREGQKVKIPKYFYGYKAHLLGDVHHGLVTGYHATTGKTADIDGGDVLMHRILTNDQRNGIKVLTADKGYGCPVWINLLQKHSGIMTAFALPDNMLKTGEHKEKWKAYVKDPGMIAFRKMRPLIERINGDLKDNHGMRRCRYLGLSKYTFQVAMSSMAHNLKIIVRALTGARFTPI